MGLATSLYPQYAPGSEHTWTKTDPIYEQSSLYNLRSHSIVNSITTTGAYDSYLLPVRQYTRSSTVYVLAVLLHYGLFAKYGLIIELNYT